MNEDELIVFVGGNSDGLVIRRQEINRDWLHPEEDDRLFHPRALNLGVYKRDDLTGEYLFIGTSL